MVMQSDDETDEPARRLRLRVTLIAAVLCCAAAVGLPSYMAWMDHGWARGLLVAFLGLLGPALGAVMMGCAALLSERA